VKEKLLFNDDLDMKKAVSIWQASEVVKRRRQAVTDGASSCTVTASVGAVRRSGKSKRLPWQPE